MKIYLSTEEYQKILSEKNQATEDTQYKFYKTFKQTNIYIKLSDIIICCEITKNYL